MHTRSIAGVVSIGYLLSACVTTWDEVDHHDNIVRDWGETRTVLRTDELPGTLELVDDALEFQIDLAHACAAIPRGHVSHVVTRKLSVSNAGLALIAFGTVAALTSIAGLGQTPGAETCAGTTCMPGPSQLGYTSPTFAIVGAAGLLTTLVTVIAASPAIPGRHHGPRFEDTVTPDAAIVDIGPPEAGIACDSAVDPIAAFGELALTSPWGAQVRAPIATDGVAHFAIDWTATHLDAADAELATKLGHGWAIRATGVELAAAPDLALSLAQRARAVALVRGR